MLRKFDRSHDRLVWRGERQPITERDLPTRIEIAWDGKFELRGPFVAFSMVNPQVGNRVVAGYPVDELRRLLEDIRSADKRAHAIFGTDTAVDLTPKIIAQLVRIGWSEAELSAAARLGARYSPGRDSVLFPPVIGT